MLTTFGTGGSGVAVNGSSEDVYVPDGGNFVEVFVPGATDILPGVNVSSVSNVQPTSVELHGIVEPEGVATTECFFEWGETTAYGNTALCAEGNVLTGSGEDPVSADLSGLTQGSTYHYRIVVTNGNGRLTTRDETVVPAARPVLKESVLDVHSESALLGTAVNPGGAATSYRFEFGTKECSIGGCISSPEAEAGSGLSLESESFEATGLIPGTTYRFRTVAENVTGVTEGADDTFTTFPYLP